MRWKTICLVGLCLILADPGLTAHSGNNQSDLCDAFLKRTLEGVSIFKTSRRNAYRKFPGVPAFLHSNGNPDVLVEYAEGLGEGEVSFLALKGAVEINPPLDSMAIVIVRGEIYLVRFYNALNDGYRVRVERPVSDHTIRAWLTSSVGVISSFVYAFSRRDLKGFRWEIGAERVLALKKQLHSGEFILNPSDWSEGVSEASEEWILGGSRRGINALVVAFFVSAFFGP